MILPYDDTKKDRSYEMVRSGGGIFVNRLVSLSR